MHDVLEQASWLLNTVGVRALRVGGLRVEGEDARVWLNGQITNDVSQTSKGDAVYALAVDIKGKILTDLYALDLGEGFEVLLPLERLPALHEHLDRYIVMEDVELEARELTIVSAQGPLATQLGGFPCDRLGTGGADLLDAQLDDLVTRAGALGGGLVGEEAWQLARLRMGRPAYGVDFDGTTYPQEAGLRDLAVSFSKGCYLGQEVVCMLENRGQLRRRLVLAESAALPEAGAALHAADKEVGSVRSGVVDPSTGQALLHAYVKRKHAEPGTQLRCGAGTITVRKVMGSETPPGAL